MIINQSSMYTQDQSINKYMSLQSIKDAPNIR